MVIAGASGPPGGKMFPLGAGQQSAIMNRFSNQSKLFGVAQATGVRCSPSQTRRLLAAFWRLPKLIFEFFEDVV
jgi:hypothetical protein